MADTDTAVADTEPAGEGESTADCEDPPVEFEEALAWMTEFEGGHPATETLRLLGRSQALAVLFCLQHGDEMWWRFTELEETLDVSTNTLSTRLDELADAGLVTRESYDEIPPHVEYAATEKAEDLQPVLLALRNWAETHEDDQLL
jgi:DNA-binding HxlR family transcriptional regulator